MATGGALDSRESGFPTSHYRRRASSRHSQDFYRAHREARPGETGDNGDVTGEDHSVSPSRSAGIHRLSSGAHDRGRRATHEVCRELSSVGRGSAETSPLRTPIGASRHRLSWSPVGSNEVHFGRFLDRKRARSEEHGMFLRRTALPAESTTHPAAASASEKVLPGAQHRQRRSRGPSLPSASFLSGSRSDENDTDELDEERGWGGMAARERTTSVRERGRSLDLAEEKREVSEGGERGELNDGIPGLPRCEAEDAYDKEGGRSEEELLGELSG